MKNSKEVPLPENLTVPDLDKLYQIGREQSAEIKYGNLICEKHNQTYNPFDGCMYCNAEKSKKWLEETLQAGKEFRETLSKIGRQHMNKEHQKNINGKIEYLKNQQEAMKKEIELIDIEIEEIQSFCGHEECINVSSPGGDKNHNYRECRICGHTCYR